MSETALEKQPQQEMQQRRQALDGLDLARLAADPNVSVEKLERLIALQERIRAQLAKEEFFYELALMQSELPVVIEKGKGDKNMSYARMEDIVETVRPTLKAHGFSFHHESKWLDDGSVLTTGYLNHSAGHQTTTEFRAKPDVSGSKNAIQAQGSSTSYGRRYTMLDLLGIVSREDDDDGKKTEVKAPEKPGNFDAWLLDLEVTAEDGKNALEAVWRSSPDDHKRYLVATDKTKWEAIKIKAAKKGKA